MSSDAVRHTKPGALRWIGIAMRGLHLVTVVVLGAALLGAASAPPVDRAGWLVLASGLTLLAVDLIRNPGMILERAGASMLLKLLIVAWMAADPGLAQTLFWVVIFWSVLFAHAPASFRHARLFASE